MVRFLMSICDIVPRFYTRRHNEELPIGSRRREYWSFSSAFCSKSYRYWFSLRMRSIFSYIFQNLFPRLPTQGLLDENRQISVKVNKCKLPRREVLEPIWLLIDRSRSTATLRVLEEGRVFCHFRPSTVPYRSYRWMFLMMIPPSACSNVSSFETCINS